MLPLFLTSDTIDILSLVYSNFCSNKIIFKVLKHTFKDIKCYFFRAKMYLIKTSIKYQSYPKSRKMEAFGQEI